VSHAHEYIDDNYQTNDVKDITHKNIEKIFELYRNDHVNISNEIKDSLLNFKGIWLGSAYSIRRKCFLVQEFRGIVDQLLLRYKINDFYQDHPIAIYLALKYNEKNFIFKMINEPLFKYRIYNDNYSGAVKSLSKALAVLRRHDATINLILAISIKLGESSKLLYSTKKELKSTEHLWLLYEGKPFCAIFKLIENSAYFKLKNMCKEIIRCLVWFILGKNIYFRVK
jgi:hypothetical protein